MGRSGDFPFYFNNPPITPNLLALRLMDCRTARSSVRRRSQVVPAKEWYIDFLANWQCTTTKGKICIYTSEFYFILNRKRNPRFKWAWIFESIGEFDISGCRAHKSARSKCHRPNIRGFQSEKETPTLTPTCIDSSVKALHWLGSIGLRTAFEDYTFGQIISFVVIVFTVRTGYADQWWHGTKDFQLGKSMRANNMINLGLRFLLDIRIFSHVIKMTHCLKRVTCKFQSSVSVSIRNQLAVADAADSMSVPKAHLRVLISEAPTVIFFPKKSETNEDTKRCRLAENKKISPRLIISIIKNKPCLSWHIP